MQRMKNTYYPTLIATSVALIYLFWWDIKGIHSGSYPGIIFVDKLAIVGFIIIGISSMISLILVWKNRKYLLNLLGVIFFLASWLNLFQSGNETIRLTGCHESACSDISLRDNGEFSMTWSLQTISYDYEGYFQIKDQKVYLFESPNFELENQQNKLLGLVSLNLEYISVEPMDFSFHGRLFKISES